MDIVSRLKEYINYKRIPTTAFADECGIARPSFSQLLNGRNKKISHELIQKIHETYHDLSVLWLMFGEGSMLVDTLTQPNNAGSSETDREISPLQNESIENDSHYDDEEAKDTEDPLSQRHIDHEQITFDFSPTGVEDYDSNFSNENRPQTITFSPNESKRIMNIIVYYSDNSFETFGPVEK